jgi:hypothetical protein
VNFVRWACRMTTGLLGAVCLFGYLAAPRELVAPIVVSVQSDQSQWLSRQAFAGTPAWRSAVSV